MDVNPGWGQRGSLLPAADAEAGDILAFHDLNYQGIALDGSQDLSGKDTLHLDLWSGTTGSVKVGLVNDGPVDKLVEVGVTGASGTQSILTYATLPMSWT